MNKLTYFFMYIQIFMDINLTVLLFGQILIAFGKQFQKVVWKNIIQLKTLPGKEYT